MRCLQLETRVGGGSPFLLILKLQCKKIIVWLLSVHLFVLREPIFWKRRLWNELKEIVYMDMYAILPIRLMHYPE